MSKTCGGCENYIKHKLSDFYCEVWEMGRQRWIGKRCNAYKGKKYDRSKFKKGED